MTVSPIATRICRLDAIVDYFILGNDCKLVLQATGSVHARQVLYAVFLYQKIRHTTTMHASGPAPCAMAKGSGAPRRLDSVWEGFPRRTTHWAGR